MSATRRVTVYVDPSSPRFLRDGLFNIDEVPFGGDELLAPFVHLRELLQSHDIPVHTIDFLPESESSTDLNLYFAFSNLRNYRRIARRRDTVLSACYAMECPVVDPSLYRSLGKAQHYFKRIMSWSDSNSLERFVGGPLRCEQFFWPQSFDDVHDQTWARDDRGFLVMINSNKLPCVYWQELYTERLRAIDYFGKLGEIDLYGQGWDKPSLHLTRPWVPWTFRRLRMAFLEVRDRIRPDPRLVVPRSVYRGRVESKRDTLGRYKFALCFENMILKGWITEKIFDCFYAGTVPVYWGAPEIAQYIPEDCYIDMNNFSSYTELRGFLKSMSDSDVGRYKERARAYLNSSEFERFSKAAFADRFVRIVAEDAKIELVTQANGGNRSATDEHNPRLFDRSKSTSV